MRDLFHYLNYQEYLHDFYGEKKRGHPLFSYRAMAMRLNLDAGFLHKVLQGKLHISPKSIPALAEFCKLGKKESLYFEYLVRYGKAKSPRDVRLYFEKLLELRGTDSRQVEAQQYAFYGKWRHSALRSLLGFHEFKGGYLGLGQRLSPPIGAREAKESVRLLEKLGFVARDEKGIYRLQDAHITTGEKWKAAAVREFQQAVIALAGESLSRHDPSERDVSTLTLALPRARMEEAREVIRNFRQTLIRLADENAYPDTVYQLNVALFPMSRPGGKP